MTTDEQIRRRFAELAIEAGQIRQQGEYTYDIESSAKWATSAANLIRIVFSVESDHYERFAKQLNDVYLPSGLATAKGVFRAAKEDFERGALTNIKRIVRADVFADFLDQAQHLLQNDYKGPAAVVAGAVLEDGLRKICEQNGFSLPPEPKLDWMNAELVKKGVYEKLWSKDITALADIRNKAAHGKWDQFDNDQVRSMIERVGRFLLEFAK